MSKDSSCGAPLRCISWRRQLDGQDTNCCPSIVVESSTLDSFVFEGKNPPPHLIKIDVEGAEVMGSKVPFALFQHTLPASLWKFMDLQTPYRCGELIDSLNYKWLKLTSEGRVDGLD